MRYLAAVGLLLAVQANLQAQAGPGGRRSRWEEERADTPIVNAKSGWIGGVTTYTRGDYQPSGVDIGLGVRTRGLPMSAVTIGVRLGSFVQNQAVLIGRTQGFFVGAAGSLRRPLGTVVEFGDEDNPTCLKVEFMLEGAATLNVNNPMPQGRTALIVAPLIVFRFGARGVLDQALSLVAGPAYFAGDVNQWHTQVSFRFQNPRH